MTIQLCIQIITALIALIASVSAFQSYSLAKDIRDEILEDDNLIFGELNKPKLHESTHSEAVLNCFIFNKSRSRKAYVEGVVVEYQGGRIDVDWGDSMDHLGNIGKMNGLIGFVDHSLLCIRRTDGQEFRQGTKVRIVHSFGQEILSFNPYANPSWSS
jgi:hypothetical protein